MAVWHEDGFDVPIIPRISSPPPSLGELSVTRQSTPEEVRAVLAKLFNLTPFRSPFNMTVQPSMSLALSMSGDNLPIGVQFTVACGQDDLSIRVATQLEKAMPWAYRWPPLRG